jgi:cellulose synthase/poly-beta-1,6-N-acetylglucosamine synthase-like glycosyltransferase
MEAGRSSNHPGNGTANRFFITLDNEDTGKISNLETDLVLLRNTPTLPAKAKLSDIRFRIQECSDYEDKELSTSTFGLRRDGQPRKFGLQKHFQATKRVVLKHIDPKTILQWIDFRELVYPFGIRKYAVLVFVGLAIATIVVTNHYFYWIGASAAITRSHMVLVLMFVIVLEPTINLILILIARVPSLKPEAFPPLNAFPGDLEKNLQSALEITEFRTALVIPCHNSDEVAIKRVLESAYSHFRPQDIFIVDNGNTKYPPDNFRQFIRQQHPDIVYIWSPIGSKNSAQLVGALAAKDYEFIMTIDDDVSIPINFRPPIDKIDHLTKAVAYPLHAIDANGQSPFFMVAWQDCEYKMMGLRKLAESALCGVLYPHGAGWFVDRETLIDLITNYHSLEFIAEDANSGLSMQKMKKRIAFDATIVLETEVPTTLFGPSLNWWQQRKNSWEIGRHSQILRIAGRLFLSLNGQTTVKGILSQKTIHTFHLAIDVIDWIKIPIVIILGSNSAFWRLAMPLLLTTMLPALALKYISARKRPDLQPKLLACLTYPFYQQLHAAVPILGAVRTVMVFIGRNERKMSVREMIEANDQRVIWKDPRFESNPAFLADEGEALKRSSIESQNSESGLMSDGTG